MRGLVVGLGSIGRRHARNWAALGLGPLSVCRRRRAGQPEPAREPGPQPAREPERAPEPERERLGVPLEAEFDDLDQALAAAPEVVLVTNPTSLHIGTALKAVRAGAHVFIEKPLGSSLADVDLLLREADARHKLVTVAYNLRFHPGLVRLRDLVQHQTIGRLVSVRAEVGEYLPDWHPWEDYRASYSGRADLGGGPVLTSSHELDAVCWLLGAPSRLTALTQHASSLEIDTEDVAEIILQFPAGPLASVHLDYLRRPPQRTIELIGEDGVLRWEYHANRILSYAPSTRQWRVEEGDPRLDRNDMYLAELRHFADCVAGRVERPRVDGAQGAAVLAIALAALESARQGSVFDFARAEEPVAAWLSSLNHPSSA